MRVLLLEDESSIRSAVARGLGMQGHSVEAAGSLAEARALAAKQSPEALVSDLKLPDGSGLDLAAELGVPFVLMTGFGTFDDAVRAMRLGCIDFFTKPVSIRDIGHSLARVAGIHGGAPQVFSVEDGAVRVAQPGTSGRLVQTVSVSWQDPAQAQNGFGGLLAALPHLRHRQLAAELMQASPAGRLTLNHHAQGWTAWLEAPVVWNDQGDRRTLIEDLSRRCLLDAHGALVECDHV